MDNFIVSARKYRPQNFKSVVGQEHITSTLKNAIARSQLAHAYLFCGPRGVGKTTCARIFAKAINCTEPVDNEACGHCESCRSFDEGRSFNIHELDAASNNSVDDIRTLIDQVRIPPQTGRYSVYIIDEVHMLSSQAFNAFLKTLEEPPAHAIFILATTEKHKVIPTILSRCQIYDFNRIRVEDSVGYLRYIASNENVNIDDESLHLIAQKADGGMRDALSMFDKAVSFCGSELTVSEVAKTLNVLDYDTYFNTMEMIAAGDYRRVLLFYDDILKRGFSGQTFLSGLGNHIRDLLMCKDKSTASLVELSGKLLDRYIEQAKSFEVPYLFTAIALLSTVDGGFKLASNQRLHVELALMKLCGLGREGIRLEPPTVKLPDTGLPQGVQGQSSQGQPTVQPQQYAPQPMAQPTVQQQSVANQYSQGGAQQMAPQTAQRPPQPIEQPVKADSRPQPQPAPKASVGVSFGGLSLAGALRSATAPQQGGEQQSTTAETVDAQAEQKILAAKEQFIEKLRVTHIRFSTVMETMKVEGNHITAWAHTQMLHDDLVSNLGEVDEVLKSVSGVTGKVEYDIKVNEEQGFVKPTKLDDRYNYLVEKNRRLVDLKRELDMETE